MTTSKRALGVTLVLAMVLAGAVGSGQASPPGFGAAAQFRLGVGARPLALGGAYTAFAEGMESLYWNPARLPWTRLSAGGMQLYPFAGGFGAALGLHVQYIGVAVPRAPFGLGFGWFNVHVSDIPYTGDGDVILYFNYDSSLVLVGAGVKGAIGEGVVGSVGGSAKLYRETMLEGMAQGAGWDLGVALDFGNWRLGYVSQDVLGTTYSWRGTGQEPVVEVPWVHRLGAAMHWLDGQFISTAEVVVEAPRPMEFRFGVEWQLGDVLALRGGVRLDPIAEAGFWSVWTVGFGVAWELFVLDAALLSRAIPAFGGDSSSSVDTYGISLGVRF